METFNHFINGEALEPASGVYIDTDNVPPILFENLAYRFCTTK